MLQELWIHLEIIQEYSSSGKGERITLGNIKLNLAEYVDTNDHSSHDSEEGVTRRYLMQDSKINSTLKISLQLKHLEGDRNYYAYVQSPRSSAILLNNNIGLHCALLLSLVESLA